MSHVRAGLQSRWSNDGKGPQGFPKDRTVFLRGLVVQGAVLVKLRATHPMQPVTWAIGETGFGSRREGRREGWRGKEAW